MQRLDLTRTSSCEFPRNLGPIHKRLHTEPSAPRIQPQARKRKAFSALHMRSTRRFLIGRPVYAPLLVPRSRQGTLQPDSNEGLYTVQDVPLRANPPLHRLGVQSKTPAMRGSPRILGFAPLSGRHEGAASSAEAIAAGCAANKRAEAVGL